MILDGDTKHILHCFFIAIIFLILIVSIYEITLYISEATRYHFRMKELDYVSKNEINNK
jgi:hypothetical protein